MSAKLVTHYRLAWNPNSNKGLAEIYFKQDNKGMKLKVDSAAELSALSSVLKESPVYMNKKGLIYTGWEEIDE